MRQARTIGSRSRMQASVARMTSIDRKVITNGMTARHAPNGSEASKNKSTIGVTATRMVDLFLLASLPFGAWRAVMPFVITFLSMDVILATLACILEREPIVRAWRILPMRLIYRPMLSYCIWKAILRAVKGALVSWGKLERTASVPVRA